MHMIIFYAEQALSLSFVLIQRNVVY